MDAAGVAGHVHNLVIDGESIYLGTHEGLFRHSPGQPVDRISVEAFDVMGLAKAADAWLASGHPETGTEGPSDLGLLASTDGGVTWTPRSLFGEVDFHRLAVSSGTVMGVSSHDGKLLRSSDEGFTWTSLGAPPLWDLALDPRDPSFVVGTTPDDPLLSSDGGTSFAPIPDAPPVALVSWVGSGLYAVDPAGKLWVSRDSGATWTLRGTVPGIPMALAVNGVNVAVLAEGTVFFSTDSGGTFAPRITGLAVH